MTSDQYQLDNTKTLLLGEDDKDEVIFCQYDIPSNGVRSAHSDSSYKRPDHEQYIFSTMDQTCYAMFSNNMVTPIRSKDSLRYSSRLLNGFGINAETSKGIYIVDFYRINKVYSNNQNDLRKLLEYYFNTKKLYPNHIEIKNQILSRLEGNSRSNSLKRPVVAKVVTFIPAHDIITHKSVYVPTNNMTILYHRLDTTEYVQPVNQEPEPKKKTHQNIVEITIMDNTKKPYYINVGNKIVRLESSTHRKGKEGFNFTYHSLGDMMEWTLGGLDELSKHGIYTTKEEAQYYATKDQAKILELQLEKEKMLLESKKLERDKHKSDIDYNLAKYKSWHEKDMMRERYQQELLKTVDAEFKSQAQVELAKQEARILGKKIELEEERQETEAIKGTFGLIGTATKLIGG